MKIAFLSYNYLPDFTSPEHWINRIQYQVRVMEKLAETCSVIYIGSINYIGKHSKNGVDYYFLNKPFKKNLFPSPIHSLLKKQKPDIVIVFGMHYPLQVIQMRIILGTRVTIINQYEADRPFKGLKAAVQRIADKCINFYFFTSANDSREWIEKKLIRNKEKCHEIYIGAPSFTKQDKMKSKIKIGMDGSINFLWVGRLNANKDPFTVLKAFEKYRRKNKEAHLHLIYTEDELLPEIQLFIRNFSLENQISLQGRIAHQELVFWYSAADFFISGSYREGGSYALLEAISCGCIPIVTNIPSAMKVIEYGKYGFYYQAGNSSDLLEKLNVSEKVEKTNLSTLIINHYHTEYSAGAIAAKVLKVTQPKRLVL